MRTMLVLPITMTSRISSEPTANRNSQPKCVHALNRHQLAGSMGRVGAAGDNAAMESFFALLHDATDLDSDERFQRGLACVLAGLAAIQ